MKYKNIFVMHRRWEKIITFGDNEIEKQKL